MALDRTLPGIQGLQHVVVLMMENRSFDHMLGALKATHPNIDGLTGNESNPDTTGALVKVQPLAEYQSQLDPDPNHHFAAVNLQIFNDTLHGSPMPATMQGFVKSYFNQQQNTQHSHDILYYFTPDKLPVLTTLATQYAVFNESGRIRVLGRVVDLRIDSWTECRITSSECIFPLLVEYAGSNLKQKMCSALAPRHLLALYHPLADDLIDC